VPVASIIVRLLLAPLFALARHSNSTLVTTLGRSLITANTIAIITASTGPIAPIDKAIAVRIDAEALATAKEALVKGVVKNRYLHPLRNKLRLSIGRFGFITV